MKFHQLKFSCEPFLSSPVITTKRYKMIEKKELLSENLKDFMDYSMDVLKSMDGTPEHTPAQQKLVNEKIQNLKIYLGHLETSYNENTPQGNIGDTTGEVPVISDIVL